MIRSAMTCVFSLIVAGPLAAHFVFIVPQAGNKDVQVIFSDDLEPDEGVMIDKIANLQLHAADAKGSIVDVKHAKAAHALTATVPAGTQVVFGKLNYGVLAKGKNPPFVLYYYPKAVLGESKAIGEKLPIEVLTVGKAGELRFQVLARGKALTAAEVSVLVPGGKRTKVTTDDKGMTPPFADSGRYGVWAKVSEAKSGEHDGKKYEEIRHYGTLVIDVGSK